MKNKRIEDKRIRNPVSPESSWRRALKDSENFRHSQKFFWAIEITGVSILGAIGGLVGFFKTPSGANSVQQFIYSSIGSVIGVVAGLVGIYLIIIFWNFFRAPYCQRNEACIYIDELQSRLSQNIEHESYYEESVKLATIKHWDDLLALSQDIALNMLVPLSIDEHYLKEDLVPEELDGIKVLVRMNTHSWSGFSIISLGVSSDTPKPDWGLYDYLLIHLAAEDSDWDSQILELKRKLINLHELYLLVAQKVVRISEKNEFFPQSWQIYFDSKGVNIFAGQFSSIIKTDIEPFMQKITPAQFELTKIVGQIRTILELVSRRRSFKGKCPACP